MDPRAAVGIINFTLGLRVEDFAPEDRINPTKAGQVPDATRVMSAIGETYNAADIRTQMAAIPALAAFGTDVAMPALPVEQAADMQMVEL